MDGDIIRGARGNELETRERCFITEAWNDSRDPAVSLAEARVLPGVVTELHRLDVDERYVVVKGEGRLSIEGLRETMVGPGDVALVPAGRAQRIENVGDVDLVFFCVCTPRFEPKQYHACE